MSSSGDKLFDRQLREIRYLRDATTLLQCRSNITDEIPDLQRDVKDLQCHFYETKTLLKKTEEQLSAVTDQLPLLKNLQESFRKVNSDPFQLDLCAKEIKTGLELSMMEQKELKQEPVETVESSSSHTSNTVTNQSNNASKPAQNKVAISILSKSEFDGIPKYIIGRNSITVLNNFIGSLNEVLQEKYQFLAMGRTKARNKNKLDKYLTYKQQEDVVKCAKGGDVHFFTEEDYQFYINCKLDKLKLTFLTALRHTKRIDFVKVGKDLYYVVA